MSRLLQQLFFVFEEVEEAIITADGDYRVVSWNKAASRLYGIPRERAVGALLSDLYAIEGEAASREKVRAAIARDGYWRGETIQQVTGGKRLPLELSLSRLEIPEADFRGIIVFVRDVSDRKRALAALAESEAKYRDLVDNSLCGIYIFQDGNLVFVNNQFLRLGGFDAPEQVLGRPFWDLVHPEDRERVKMSGSLRERGELPAGQIQFRAVNVRGETVWAEVRATSITYEGRPAVLGTVMDLTEQRRGEEERKRLEQQLFQAQKMEAVGRLAGGVAHDFNNLLTGVLGHLSLAFRHVDPASPLWRYLGGARDSANRGAQLIRQLLAFSRHQVVEIGPVDLNRIIENLREMLGMLLEERISIRIQLSPGLCAITANAAQMEQIIVNLTLNARDAIHGQGTITIATSDIPAGPGAALSGAPSGELVALTVSDDGSGMDEETKRRIFEPFFTTKSKEDGTGLGLSTVWGIVSQHRGVIDVDSAPGRGTTVTVLFPRSTDARSPSQPDIGEDADLPRGDEVVLAVEDDQAICTLNEIILREAGYRVFAWRSAGEALEWLAKTPVLPDILMTDIVLPDLDGVALAERVAAACPRIRILFTSGYADTGSRAVTLVKGRNFLPKPYTAFGLTHSVRKVLDAPAVPTGPRGRS